MRRTSNSIAFLAGLVLVSIGGDAQVRPTIHGTVAVSVETCCGGAMPAPGATCATVHPYAGEVIIRGGTRNAGPIVARGHTDAQGAFSVPVSANGTWCLVTAEKAAGADPPRARQPNVDAACMERYLAACDAIVVLPTTESVGVRVVQPCRGQCYAGPVPP